MCAVCTVQAWSQLDDKVKMPFSSGYEEDGFLRLLNVNLRSDILYMYVVGPTEQHDS